MLKRYETTRLVLREIVDDDLPAIFENLSDHELTKFYDLAPVETLDQVEFLVSHWHRIAREGTGLRWAIASKDSDRLIGTCGFHCMDAARGLAQIGYEVNRHYWGRGIMSEVLPVVLKHAFANLSLNRVAALIEVDNTASIALIGKFGFQCKELIRGHVVASGRRADTFLFELKAGESRYASPAPRKRLIDIPGLARLAGNAATKTAVIGLALYPLLES